MGKIKKITENELVGGTQNTDVYPVTSVKAVYDENNERLDNILNRSGVVNISTNYNADHIAEVLTLEQAIAKVPSKDRVLGFQGKFLSENGWKSYVFIGDSIADWTNKTKWNNYLTGTDIVQESGEAEDKVMSQKSVSAKLSDLSSNISEKTISKFEQKPFLFKTIELNIKENSWQKNLTEEVVYENSYSAIIDIPSGSVAIKISVGSLNKYYNYLSFFDKDNKFINGMANNQSIVINSTITIPFGCTKIVVNSYKQKPQVELYSDFTIKVVDDNKEHNQSMINNKIADAFYLEDIIANTNISLNKYITDKGEFVVANNNNAVISVDYDKTKIYYVSTLKQKYLPCVVYTDANEKVVGVEDINESDVYYNQILNVPLTCAKIHINCSSVQLGNFAINSENIHIFFRVCVLVNSIFMQSLSEQKPVIENNLNEINLDIKKGWYKQNLSVVEYENLHYSEITNFNIYDSLYVTLTTTNKYVDNIIYFDGAYPLGSKIFDGNGKKYEFQKLNIPSRCNRIIIQSNDEDIHLYKLNKNELSKHCMCWFGTSIPAAGLWAVSNKNSYPLMVGEKLKFANTYNEAVGSSAANGSTKPSSYEVYSRRMGHTIEQKIKLFEDCWNIDYENKTVSIGKRTLGIWGIPNISTFNEAIHQLYLLIHHSYEIKLMTYLISNEEEHWNWVKGKLGKYYDIITSNISYAWYSLSHKDADIFVLDHSVNDVGWDDYNDINDTDITKPLGAINTYIGLIYQYCPKAKIVIVSNYNNETNPSANPTLEKIAKNWQIPYIRMYELLPFMKKSPKVLTRGYWDNKQVWHDSGFEWSESDNSYTTNLNLCTDLRGDGSLSQVKANIEPTQINNVWYWKTTQNYIYMFDGLHPHSDKTNVALSLYANCLSAAFRKLGIEL